jgi:hypothetical protein
MIAWPLREVDGIRILMFSSRWPSGGPGRNGFQTETLLGDQRTKRGNICMPLKRGPQRGRVNVGIRARCGTGRACLTVSGLAVAKFGLKARPMSP